MGKMSGACSVRPVASAKADFIKAVKQSVSDLIRRHGYCRERAISLILSELNGGNLALSSSVNDEKIFAVMRTYGIGMDDASQALTVSRAIKYTCKERDVSTVEAIEELTSRLSLENLLLQPRDVGLADGFTISAHGKTAPIRDGKVIDSRSRLSQPRKTPSTRKASKITKAGKQKSPKCAVVNTKTNGKQLLRKRVVQCLNDNRKGNEAEQMSRRTRSDSVTEVVNAKRTKMNVDESASSQDCNRARSPSPAIVRKRSHRVDDTGPTANAPSMKRARTER